MNRAIVRQEIRKMRSEDAHARYRAGGDRGDAERGCSHGAPLDAASEPLVALADKQSPPAAAATLAEIRASSQRASSQRALRIAQIPAIWRALAHHPRQLESMWRKNRLVLAAGVLDEATKAGAALAVAQFRQSAYNIAYFTQFLRVSCGFDDRTLVEGTAMMMHSLSFNTIVHGMHLEVPMSDLAAVDFGPGGRFEDSPRPGRPAPGNSS